MLFFLLPSIVFEWMIARGPRDLIYYVVIVAVLIALNLAAIVDDFEGREL